jgi:hypothetical protein
LRTAKEDNPIKPTFVFGTLQFNHIFKMFLLPREQELVKSRKIRKVSTKPLQNTKVKQITKLAVLAKEQSRKTAVFKGKSDRRI